MQLLVTRVVGSGTRSLLRVGGLSLHEIFSIRRGRMEFFSTGQARLRIKGEMVEIAEAGQRKCPGVVFVFHCMLGRPNRGEADCCHRNSGALGRDQSTRCCVVAPDSISVRRW
jgi:hypothetical protein